MIKIQECFTPKVLDKIRKAHPLSDAQIAEILVVNPYKLVAIDGIRFSTIDTFATQHCGVSAYSLSRIEQVIVHEIGTEHYSDGHTYHPKDNVLIYIREFDLIDKEQIIRRIGQIIQTAKPEIVLVNDKFEKVATWADASYIGLSRHYDYEVFIAEKLKMVGAEDGGRRVELEMVADILTSKGIGEVLRFNPTDEQIGAIVSVFDNPITIITGGPGTGKTSILRALHHVCVSLGIADRYAAFTGRAAKRIEEAIDLPGVESSTIHRLLAYSPTLGFSVVSLVHEVLVIDEMSMIDLGLFRHLIMAIDFSRTRLVLVGDVNQLPAIGVGRILWDMLESGRFNTVIFSKPFRQARNSLIIRNAWSILDGSSRLEFPQLLPNGGWGIPGEIEVIPDMYFVSAPQESVVEKIVQIATEQIPALFGISGWQNIQILSPLYDAVAGINKINDAVRRAIFGEGVGNNWRVGDKVICTKNNYEIGVMNGDLGFVTEIRFGNKQDVVGFSVKLYDGVIVKIPRKCVDEWNLGYCMSYHRSQGGEYPCVIIPVVKAHSFMVTRQLIYTAITRASKKLILVGDYATLQGFIRNNSKFERTSGLRNKLMI